MKQVLDARCPWCFAFGVGVVVMSSALLIGRGEAQASRVQVQAESDANHRLGEAGLGWLQVRIADAHARLEGEAADDAMRVEALATARRVLAPMTGFPGVFAAVVDGMTVASRTADEIAWDDKVAARPGQVEGGVNGRDVAPGSAGASSCEAAVTAQLASNAIRFDFASARLSAQGLAALEAVLPLLKTCPPGSVTVVAHADASGDRRRNEILALARAQAVQAALSQGGWAQPVPHLKGVVDAPGVGDSAADAAISRRVEFVVSASAQP